MILHLVSIKNITFKSSYNWFKIDILRLPRPPTASAILSPGLHKLWYPGIRDTSTWSKFGAHGEHGDVFPFSNLGAL